MFVVWEVKGSDQDPRARVNEIRNDFAVEVPTHLSTLVAPLTRRFGSHTGELLDDHRVGLDRFSATFPRVA
jgi:hypothetical protein